MGNPEGATQVDPRAEIREVLRRVEVDVVRCYIFWNNYKKLSVDNPRVHLLNHTASGFFGLCQVAFQTETLIALSRLCDPPESCGKKNASIGYLQRLIRGYCSVDSALAELADRIEVHCNEIAHSYSKIKPFRNKFLSHSDLEHSAVKVRNVGANAEQIESILTLISNVLNEVLGEVSSITRDYKHLTVQSDSSCMMNFIERHTTCSIARPLRRRVRSEES